MQLAEAVGRRLAELTGAEWGMVSSGCAAGLKHVAAACVAGGNPEKLLRIPDLTGFDKTEVVAPRSARNAYDHAIRNIGVRMITVETAEELERALSSRTAMIYLSAGGSGPLALENVAKMAKPRDIPILVDAAAEVLTIPNVHLQHGATIVAYSGGKAICGPQCAGLLLGRKDILLSAWQASAPHHGPGRDNKVGREETLGMLAAVETWVKRDHEAEWKKWLSYLDTIAKRVSQVDGINAAVREPRGLSNKSPALVITWDPAKLHTTGEEVAEEVARTKPSLGGGVNDFVLHLPFYSEEVREIYGFILGRSVGPAARRRKASELGDRPLAGEQRRACRKKDELHSRGAVRVFRGAFRQPL